MLLAIELFKKKKKKKIKIALSLGFPNSYFYNKICSGAPNDNFRKISVRTTI